ncbi:MAG: solute carrier family 13 (sodium-dependent dicarboxylate transporter), er 2/3/5 [Thermoleophilaceae bacterium]|jgi:sodium-dependent dicarboxylate transporter 2/3/5|nr:solute carrier family 13 (sodium-dependent dicarboxylate transporter), er 2/3/5 [Thermoleophilaceae bacterium]
MAIDTEERAPGSAQGGDSPEENLTGGGTYKTLDEQQGRLSPAEERFERQRRTVGLFLGPIVLGAMLLIPFDLDGNQHRLAAILAFVVVWWVTEAIPIPMTALLGVVLCALLEATPPPPEGDSSVDVVFALFTDDTVMLFIGSFIIAQAMVVHGMHRRLAYRVLSFPWVGGNTYRIILAFGLIGAITSPVMSNTAGAAMMLPIALGVMGVVGGMVAKQAGGEHRVERLRFGAALMLVITYSITVGGLLLPIGSPPNLIGRELLEAETGEPITFFEWFLMALPIVLVMFVAVVVIVLAFNRPEVKEVEGVEEYVREEREKLGRLSRGERNTLAVLGFALVGWFLPGLVGIVAGDNSDAYTQVSEAANEGIVAILAATLLFVLPVDWKRRKFTLNWNQASQIDWGTVILFGGGLVLGSLLSQTGLAEVVGKSLSDSIGVSSLVGITIVIVVVAVLVSETTSNTASAAIMVPIAISIAAASGVNPTIPALAAIFGANYGFMLPVSTPPNAIVYSSGLLPITRMIKAGAVFDIIGAVLCVAGVISMANLVGLV